MNYDSCARPHFTEDGTTQSNRREAYFASPLAMYALETKNEKRKTHSAHEQTITIGMRVATERVASLVPTSLEDGNSQPETTGGAICLPARHL